MYNASVNAEGDDIRGALLQSLLLVGRRWRVRLNERLKPVGQTDARLAALTEVAEAPDGVVQRALADRLGVEEPTVVRLIDALQASGWVERAAHSRDRRAKVVTATAAAGPVLVTAQAAMGELHQEVFEGLDPGELAVCVRVLGELSRRLDRPGEA